MVDKIFSLIGVVLIIVFVGALLWALSAPSYADGYCAALNGTVLNQNSCNVDGKVVEVR